MADKEIFDEWPDRYEEWFSTPIGKLVRKYEVELVLDLLKPGKGERILDAGCGTGVFTTDFLAAGAIVSGLDISVPMLKAAIRKTQSFPFSALRADMGKLPFKDDSFDKTVSVTALEFIENGKGAIDELFRVTMPGGWVVIATLNALSPWAERRKAKTERGQRHILEDAFYRSPADLLALSPYKGTTKTVIHFLKDAEPDQAVKTEHLGQSQGLDTGAFVAVKWQKPHLKS